MHQIRMLLAILLAASMVAARPDTFTREELIAIEREHVAAEARLAAMRDAEQLVGDDLKALDTDLLSAAMEARRREEQATAAEAALASLALRRTEAEARLLTGEQALEDLLATIAASNRRRPPALVVSPGKANTAIRRAILMGDVTPRLQVATASLGAEITDLNRLEKQILTEQARLESAQQTLALKKEDIERLAAVKRTAFEGLSGDLTHLRTRAETLGKEAETLRDLLAALEAGAPAAPGVKPASRPQPASIRKPGPAAALATPAPSPASARPLGKAALGGLMQPAAGTLTYRFGDTLPGGGKTEWIRLQTREEAQVVAPVGGQVEYARPFRSYGAMLILRTSDGYDVILTGMSRIYVSEGQKVAAGEPVGRMSDRTDPPPELSMELRLGDRVLNPAEWLPRDR